MNAILAVPDDDDGHARTVTFEPVGPVARAFINDLHVHQLDHGALRLGQDDQLLPENPQRAMRQKPGRDGVRRIRVCVIRATYSQLETNVMKDWFSWFPRPRTIGTASTTPTL
jgi:hypothetical protein